MKNALVTSLAIASAVATMALGAGLASAQPGNAAPSYYAPPPPPPSYAPPTYAPVRRGLTLGGDLGIGGMNADSGAFECFNCEGDPPAVALSTEIGAMINPRLAILLHGRWTIRQIDTSGESFYNAMALIGVKYWLSRRLWIKGGLGFASVGINYDDGESEELDSGGAGLLGVGFEIVHSRRFALDLSLTGTTSSFDEIGETVNSGVISLGFSWF